MGNKRKHDEQARMASMPRDEMPPERSSDTSHSFIRDVLIQFKDVIQVKVNTDELLQTLVEKVQKLEEKVQKLEEKVKKLEEKLKSNKTKEVKRKKKMTFFKENVRRQMEEYKMDLRLELQNNKEKLEENIENQSKQNLSLFKEDPKKELEVKEEPNLRIQEEMQKELCAKGHHYNGSPSLRSQPHQNQTTTYRLEFACKIDTIVYKGKPIRTSDSDHIQVVLYNGDNQIAPDHYLASATVELVVIYGEFSGHTRGYWAKDEFLHNIAKLRQVNNSTGEPPKLRVKNGKFKLVGGRYCHEGVVIMDNSNRKDVKLGAMIVGNTEERVLEGVSNIFRVQEAKTENRARRPTGDTAEDLRNGSSYLLPFDNLQHTTQHNTTHPENYGHGLQHSFLRPEHNFLLMPNQVTYSHTTGNGPVSQPLVDQVQQQKTQLGATQQEDHAQGPRHSYLQPQHNFAAIMPNQGTHAHTAENGSSGQPQLDHVQRQNIQHGATQQEDHGQGPQYVRPKGGPINLHITPNASSITYPHTTGQGQQHNFPRPPNNFDAMQSRVILAQTAGNGSGVQPLIDHVQKHITQQGATQQENHAGQGQQHILPNNGPINFPTMSNLPGITYPCTSGIGSVGPLPSEYPTQQEIIQVESSGLGLDLNQLSPQTSRILNYWSEPTHVSGLSASDGLQNTFELPVEYQDGRAIGAPRTVAPVPQRTQMDSFQAMAPEATFEQ